MLTLTNYKIQSFLMVAITVFSLQGIFISATMVGDRVLGDGNWGTHMAPLTAAVVHTQGAVLELGCGDYSTPLLHSICSLNKRRLVSSDSNAQWLNLFMDMENSWHQFIHVTSNNDWQMVGKGEKWAVVFVDQAPVEYRLRSIKILREMTDVFVIHDSQDNGSNYSWYPYLNTFKYKYVYKRYKVETMVASDTIDVEKFFE